MSLMNKNKKRKYSRVYRMYFYIKRKWRSHFLSLTGFTLIEVMLALFITAILTAILAVVFNTSLRSYRQGKDLLAITRRAQLMLGQMTRELPGTMVQGNVIPFIGNGSSVFFMAPIPNSSKLDLCEVGYIWDNTNSELNRHFLTTNSNDFEYPNKVNYNGLHLQLLCDRVVGFNLGYYPVNGNWGNSWSNSTNLPQMVSVTANIQGEYPKNAPQQKKTFTTWIYLPNSTNNP